MTGEPHPCDPRRLGGRGRIVRRDVAGRRKPRQRLQAGAEGLARFLGTEITFVYKLWLLVVMRDGLGFNWPHHPAAGAFRRRATLASAAGVKVSAPANVAASGRSSPHTGPVILAAPLAALLLAAAKLVVLRRRGG